MRPTDRPKRDAYMEKASNKKAWIAKADDLLAAASILKPEVEKHYRSWKEESAETPLMREGIVEGHDAGRLRF